MVRARESGFRSLARKSAHSREEAETATDSPTEGLSEEGDKRVNINSYMSPWVASRRGCCTAGRTHHGQFFRAAGSTTRVKLPHHSRSRGPEMRESAAGDMFTFILGAALGKGSLSCSLVAPARSRFAFAI